MFHTDLPAEITLLILSYLPVTSIGALRRVKNEWDYFVRQNSSTVYRNAAFQEGFIRNNHTLLSELSEGNAHCSKALRGVDSWEALCRRKKLISRSWAGKAPSRVISSPRVLPSPLALNTPENSHYRRVHRIKIDEDVGIVITTTELGGLIVRDIDSDEVLWELPIWYVHSHAHLEYERGYIIFDRTDGNKEVWRRTEDVEADAVAAAPDPSTSTADGLQTGQDMDDTPIPPPRPTPDQRQLHVANYLHTLAAASAVAAASAPGPSISTDATGAATTTTATTTTTTTTGTTITTTTTTATPQTPPRKSAAHFSPYCVLTMPEPTRAFRFVYPALLVAATDRAHVFDVPSGRVVQTVGDLQRMRRVRVDVEVDDERDDDDEGDTGDEPGDGSESRPASDSDGVDTEDEDAGVDAGVDDDDDNDDDDDDVIPDVQFLGQIRYVDLSARHIFVAGRHIMRVFSRATGRCVWNLSSTRAKYGAWGWAVCAPDAVRAEAGVQTDGEEDGVVAEGEDVDTKGKGKDAGDENPKGEFKELYIGKGRKREAYGPPSASERNRQEVDMCAIARAEGREVARMPVRFAFVSEARAGDGDRMVIDQFVAVHVSRDGKHITALLSGARLVVLHHFEALLARHTITRARRGSRRGGHNDVHVQAQAPGLTSGGAQSQSDVRLPWSLKERMRKQDAAAQVAAQTERDKDLFMHTMDVRLGHARECNSVYLAYEHGRVGVVTSNTVYIVTPTVPPPPGPVAPLRLPALPRGVSPSASVSSPQLSFPAYPYPPPPPLTVGRLPYFVNPSWLGAVSCLMLSETGLYLNWNPCAPVTVPLGQRALKMAGVRVGRGMGVNAHQPHVHNGAGMFLDFGAAQMWHGDDEEEEDEEEEWDEDGDWEDEDGEEDAGGWAYEDEQAQMDWEELHGTGNGTETGTGDADADADGTATGTGTGIGDQSSHNPASSHEDEVGATAPEHASGIPGGILPSSGPMNPFLHPRHRAHHRRANEHNTQELKDRDEEYRRIWEEDYMRDLRDMDDCEDDWYQALPNGDMFVATNPRAIEVSEVSTVFAVEFVPDLREVGKGVHA